MRNPVRNLSFNTNTNENHVKNNSQTLGKTFSRFGNRLLFSKQGNLNFCFSNNDFKTCSYGHKYKYK